jgi:hypothetical protein
MDTAIAAFDFIHSEPAGPDQEVTTGLQAMIFSPFPGTYAAGYVHANDPSELHWSASVPYVAAGICAVLLYLVV